jgi:outer membrane protein TolC
MGRHFRSSALALAISLLTGLCRVAGADGVDDAFAEHVDLPALQAYAIRNNPEIVAMGQRWRAAQARPSQEGTLPDPTLNMAYHNESFDRFTQGSSDFSWLRFGVEQEVPFPGKLGLKETVAAQEAEREGALFRATALNVVTRLRVAYSDYVLAYRSIDVLQKNEDLLATLERGAEARYRVGEGMQQDVLRAQVEVSILVGRLTSLEQARTSAAAMLNGLLNRPPFAALGAPTPIETGALSYSLDELEHMVREQSPVLQAADLDTARSDTTVSLAKRQYYPDFVLWADYYNKAELVPEWEVGLGIRAPLYFWRKQAYGVQEAAAGAEEARAARQNTVQDLLARVKDLYAQASAADRLVKLYQDTVVPQAEQSLRSALAGYQVGQVDFLTLLNSFTVLNDYQLRAYEERANREKAVAGLEDLAGVLPELPTPQR